jgi:hypothetical protein
MPAMPHRSAMKGRMMAAWALCRVTRSAYGIRR